MSTLPEAIKKPYPFHSHFLDLGEKKLHYLDEGVGERPILMLHGNPTWSFFYRHLISDLRDAHRCIAPDHLGCGLSSKPQDYPYRLVNHIDNMERLVDHLSLPHFNLVVHDWGGPIGIGLAERMPERIGQLVIFNTAAFRSARMPFSLKLCRTPLLGALLIRRLNTFARVTASWAVSKPMDPAVRAGFLYPYHNWQSRIALLRFVEDIPMDPGHPTYALLQEIERDLIKLKDKPMLLCWGMRDFVFTGDFLKTWQEHFPQAEVHRFEEANHYLLEDAGEAIIPLVRRFFERPQRLLSL